MKGQIRTQEEVTERLNLAEETLPHWEQVPPVYQRELMLVLTSLVVKQLAASTSGQQRCDDDAT